MPMRVMPVMLVVGLVGGCRPAEAPVSQPVAPASQPAEAEPFGRLTVDEVEAGLKAAAAGTAKFMVFDNNAEARFQRSHVPGARWVKFDAVTAADLPADKDTTLVFYCANEH